MPFQVKGNQYTRKPLQREEPGIKYVVKFSLQRKQNSWVKIQNNKDFTFIQGKKE